MSTHSMLNVNQNPTDLWSQLRSDLRANFFLLQACLAYVPITALCYTQSAITTSQATVEILFADICRTWDLRSKNGLKWSPSIQFNKISREHDPRTLCILLAVCRLWPHHIEIACYVPIMCLVGNSYHQVYLYWGLVMYPVHAVPCRPQCACTVW